MHNQLKQHAKINGASMSICVEGVVFSYDGSRTVLNRVSLDVQSGELVAVVGPSGSGKSTLLRLIAGLLPKRPSSQQFSGEIRVGNTLVRAGSVPAGQLSFMFQEPALLPNRTVLGNITLPLEMRGISHGEASRRAEPILRTVGLGSARSLHPRQLSVGMKTRVSLAMSVVCEPTWILFDEPFSSLDFAWRLSLYATLTTLRQRSQCTILLVTHDLREAILLADRIIVLGSDGRTLPAVTVGTSKPTVFSPAEINMYSSATAAQYGELEAALVAASSVPGESLA